MNIYKKLQQKGWDHQERKKINHDLDRLEQETRAPSKEWKKKYPCKKNKGQHEYELILPPYTWRFGKNIQHITLNEYYRLEKEEYETKANARAYNNNMFGGGIFCHWKCKHCGKLEWDTTNRPEKKIRNNITKTGSPAWLLNYNK